MREKEPPVLIKVLDENNEEMWLPGRLISASFMGAKGLRHCEINLGSFVWVVILKNDDIFRIPEELKDTFLIDF